MRNWFYEQMAMYSAYHRNGLNQITHHVGVPMIVFSLLVILSTVKVADFDTGPLTLAAVLMGFLLLFYVLVAPLVGVIAALFYGFLMVVAEGVSLMETPSAWQSFLGLFILGWVIQFTGHIFEKRKPALFDNLMQVFMAPSFLIAEVLFMAGLEQALKAEIEARMPKYMPKEN